jgi:hypothetical protein
MTISPGLINSGVPFVSSDILPATEVNKQTNNGIVAWLDAAGLFGKSVQLDSASSLKAPSRFYTTQNSTPCLGKIVTDVDEGQAFLTCWPDGTVSGGSVASTFTSVAVHKFSEYYSKWYLFEYGSSSTWYRSTGESVVALDVTGTFSSAMTVAAVDGSYLINTLYVCGSNTSNKGRIVKITATTASNYFNHATHTGYNSIAIYYNVDTSQDCGVAVAANGAVYTIDSGATWTDATLPTMPAQWDGNALTVVYDVSWGFILSGVRTDGRVFWSTSPTGGTWQPFQTTPQVIWGGATPTKMGMCALGNVLCCPWVTVRNSVNSVGLIVSIDNGASWYLTANGATFYSLNDLKCIRMDNRIAIISGTNAVISAPLVTRGTL